MCASPCLQPVPEGEEDPNKKRPYEENTLTQLAKTALWMLIIYWFITVLTMLFPSSNRPEQVSQNRNQPELQVSHNSNQPARAGQSQHSRPEQVSRNNNWPEQASYSTGPDRSVTTATSPSRSVTTATSPSCRSVATQPTRAGQLQHRPGQVSNITTGQCGSVMSEVAR